MTLLPRSQQTRRYRFWRRWSPWSLQRQVATFRTSYEELWLDHLNRCGCHDSWDQCEHTASGQHTPDCGCCKWC